jgi:hypothetical protein
MDINAYNLSMASIKAKVNRKYTNRWGGKNWPRIRCSLCGQLDVLPQFAKLSPGKVKKKDKVVPVIN